MRKKIIATIVASACIVTSMEVFAGLHNLTHHSRANCVNNESISWEFNVSRMMRTKSTHFINNGKGGLKSHVVDTGWQNTWRSAAVHYGRGQK